MVTPTSHDPRLTAFLSHGPEVFHAVEHRHEVWTVDPFDVPQVHQKARDAFSKVLGQAITPPGLPAGRILLILGESGSGKTHLMRVFRNQVHGSGDGLVGYVQLNTSTQNYGRYFLVSLIESLDKPYRKEQSDMVSGLTRLSDLVTSRCLGEGALARLRDEEFSLEELAGLVSDASDYFVRQPGFDSLDLDIVRALVYLQRGDARIKTRVLKYLRCEDLSQTDRNFLGGLVPRAREDDPARTVQAFGQILWATTGKSLVLCLDQMEDIWSMPNPKERFRQAMNAVCEFVDRVPSSLVVISCLEDVYQELKPNVTRSVRDRLEADPAPCRLKAERPLEEVKELLGRRLAHFYEQADVPFDTADATYPIPLTTVEAWASMRTRDVLEHCRCYREEALALGHLPGTNGRRRITYPPKSDPYRLTPVWNAFRIQCKVTRPEQEADIAALLGWGIDVCGEELESDVRFKATVSAGTVEVQQKRGGKLADHLFVGVCNKAPQGGHLAKQITALHQAAEGRIPVLVRTTPFPSKAGQMATEALGKVITAGGRRAVLEDSDTLTLLAMQQFREAHGKEPDFARWLGYENPLTQLQVLRGMLNLDAVEPAGHTPASDSVPTPKSVSPPIGGVSPLQPARNSLCIGTEEGLARAPVALPLDDLRTHAAILGGSGSGKSSLALRLVEELLLGGVPVIMVDRKGDLASFLNVLGGTAVPKGARAERQRKLQGGVDSVLYTPGEPRGRPLRIALLPEGLEGLRPDDREDEVRAGADALGDVLEYKRSGKDQSCRTLLTQGLGVLAEATQEVTLEGLIHLMDDQDPAFLARIGRLDVKLCHRMVQDLETFRLSQSGLLDGPGEPLSIDALFGYDGSVPTGKTRLSVLSTKGLRHAGEASFWLAQFLLQLGRWMNRRPSEKLQGVVFFDEADIYLPAMSQPATKAPMENLLRRARGAGLGIVLGTQSPGDLDYKCRDNIKTWMVGRIREARALEKLRPLFSGSRADVASKLPSREAGQFFLLSGAEVTGFLAELPVRAPEQLSEAQLVELARQGGGAKGAS